MLLYTFGPRYDLPLPLSTFQWAGAAVVGISFIMMTVFASHRTGPSAVQYRSREVNVLGWLPGSSLLHGLAGLIGVVGLLAVIVTGLFGPSQPDHNLAVLLTWVYFWAGMAVLSGLVGPLWNAVSPFKALDAVLRWLLRRKAPAEAEDRLARLGVWPAVGAFFLFGLFDVTGVSTNRPWLMALLALAYTVFTL